MDTIITSLANSILSGGAITEVHIILGLFIITIISLRKTKPPSSGNSSGIYDDLSTKIDDLQQKIKDLNVKND